MLELAKYLPPSRLAEKAYARYEKFRPEIPPSRKWEGASGKGVRGYAVPHVKNPRPKLKCLSLLEKEEALSAVILRF